MRKAKVIAPILILALLALVLAIFAMQGTVCARQNSALAFDETASEEIAIPADDGKIEIDMTQYVEFTQTTFPWDGNAHAIKVQLKMGIAKYPTQVDETATVYTYSQGTSIIPEADVKDSGTYSVKVEFGVKAEYATDYKIKAPIIATLTILDPTIELEVTWDGTDFPYDHGNVICPKPTFIRVDNGQNITFVEGTDYEITGDNNAREINNSYKITLTLIGAAATTYSIKDGKTPISIDKTFNITICELETPYVAEETKIVYNGAPQNVADVLTGYDATIMSVTNGGTQTNAKRNYKAYITLSDTTNYKWKDSATATVAVDWTISKRMLDVIWDETEFVKKGNTTYSPKVASLSGICAIDQNKVDILGQTDFIYDGDRDKSADGNYTTTVAFSEKAENSWATNYELNPASAIVAWIVLPKAGMEIINITWNVPEYGYVFNNNIQGPKIEDATFTDSDGIPITGAKLAEIKAALKIGGDATTSKWAGDYEATVSLGTNSKYYIKEGATVQYTIVEDGDGNGAAPVPVDPSNPAIGGGNNGNSSNSGSTPNSTAGLQPPTDLLEGIKSGSMVFILIAIAIILAALIAWNIPKVIVMVIIIASVKKKNRKRAAAQASEHGKEVHGDESECGGDMG